MFIITKDMSGHPSSRKLNGIQKTKVREQLYFFYQRNQNKTTFGLWRKFALIGVALTVVVTRTSSNESSSSCRS
jgi:hypothetical protein